jgi:CcmD family protein
MKRRLRPIMAAALVLAASLAGSGMAAAQQFVKVDEATREQIPAVPFVAIAYGFIWVGVLLYVLVLARGIASVRVQLEDVRRRLADAESAPGAHR